MIVGILGLHVFHSPVHNASLNEELPTLDVEVAPLQACDLAYAKSIHWSMADARKRQSLPIWTPAIYPRRTMRWRVRRWTPSTAAA